MTTLEIILLIAGAVILILGYAVPAGRGKNEDGSKALTNEEIHESVNREVEASRGRLEGIVDETVDYAMDKTERSLERVTNDKMMALSDYSNTILEDINKNHKEVLFMYDMLHDKHENLKSTVSEASAAEKKVKEATREAQEVRDIQNERSDDDGYHDDTTSDRERAEGADTADDNDHEEKISSDEPFVPFVPQHIMVEEDSNIGTQETETIEPVVFKPVSKDEHVTDKKKPAAKKTSSKNKKNADVMSDDKKPAGTSDNGKEPVIQFAQGMQSRNNNEKILKLHNEGRSNTAIAKELGLGIGEVKLVIDLYENK